MENKMKNELKDLKTIAQRFFAAYDAHDVEGMLSFCADGAQGRYAPYGRNSVVPIRGGLDAIWRAFPQAVPNFRVEVVEIILGEGDTVVAQTVMSGPMPGDPLGIAKKGQVVFIPHAYILRSNAEGKITRLDAYWGNAALNGIKASAL
jgi:ketosteroid isomerase-like protein